MSRVRLINLQLLKKINIDSRVSVAKINELLTFIGCKLNKITIGGNYSVSGGIHENTFSGNQISVNCRSSDGDRAFSIFTSVEARDDYGEYSRIFLSFLADKGEPFWEDYSTPQILDNLLVKKNKYFKSKKSRNEREKKKNY